MRLCGRLLHTVINQNEGASMAAPPRDAFSADCLILGGGVQGVWLLRELADKGVNVLLLERGAQPGHGQTGHSHLFLHQGHIYATLRNPTQAAECINGVKDARELWNQALSSGCLAGLTTSEMPFYIGFRNGGVADNFLANCLASALPCVR